MIQNYGIAGLILSVAILQLLGCGEKTVTTTTTAADSQTCIECHADKVSPVTGKLIVTEWQASVHNTQNVAGCADCHEPDQNHPASCNRCHSSTPVGSSATSVTHNPDAANKCSKCHTLTTGYSTTDKANSHFKNFTSATITRPVTKLYYSTIETYTITKASNSTANWVASAYKPVNGDSSKYGCRACHNPHDTSSNIEILRQWAQSGHGETNTAPRTALDFKTLGVTVTADATMGSICVRCHTSTGFINYVKSDYKNVSALAAANSADHTKEVTGCNVCHDDGNGNAYSYKIRDVLANSPGRTGVPAFFNYSSRFGGNARGTPSTNVTHSFEFPYAANSNVCVVCHMGREAGDVIKKAYLQGVKFTKTARISAHDFAGGANLFQKSGFEFYDAAAGKYPQDTDFLHYKAGMSNFQGTGNNGPCIACHMNSTVSHSFMPITKALDGTVQSIVSATCAKCHTTVAASKPMATKDDLEGYRLGFKAAMIILRDLILNIDSATIPSLDATTKEIKYPSSSTSSQPNWVKFCVPGATTMAQDVDLSGVVNPVARGVLGKGAYTMGAAFNYELLYADYGAYVHNPDYIKRLLFDSIAWLRDDGNKCTLPTSASDETAICNFINSKDPTGKAKAYLCPNNVRP